MRRSRPRKGDVPVTTEPTPANDSQPAPAPAETKTSFSLDELAARWCVHPETIRMRIKRKQLAAFSASGRRGAIRITIDEILRVERGAA